MLARLQYTNTILGRRREVDLPYKYVPAMIFACHALSWPVLKTVWLELLFFTCLPLS